VCLTSRRRCRPLLSCQAHGCSPDFRSFPTRRSSDLGDRVGAEREGGGEGGVLRLETGRREPVRRWRRHRRFRGKYSTGKRRGQRSEEHTSELQSREKLVCRLLLEEKKRRTKTEASGP